MNYNKMLLYIHINTSFGIQPVCLIPYFMPVLQHSVSFALLMRNLGLSEVRLQQILVVEPDDMLDGFFGRIDDPV